MAGAVLRDRSKEFFPARQLARTDKSRLVHQRRHSTFDPLGHRAAAMDQLPVRRCFRVNAMLVDEIEQMKRAAFLQQATNLAKRRRLLICSEVMEHER